MVSLNFIRFNYFHASLASIIFFITGFLYASHVWGNIGIHDGNDAAQGQFPWFGAIESTTDPIWSFCGGVLVGPRWVLTAHHCLSGRDPNDLIVLLNSVKLVPPFSSLTQVIPVDSIYWYDYTAKDQPHVPGKDLALLHLKDPAQGIIPIPLSEFPPNPGDSLIIMGYGDTDSTGSLKLLLQYAFVKIRKNNVCELLIDCFVPVRELCSQALHDGYALKGDSGGPLIQLKQGQYYLAGIISTSAKLNPTYTIYTSVSFFDHYRWINEKISHP